MFNRPCALRTALTSLRAAGSSSRVRDQSFCRAPRLDAPIWGFSGSPYESHIVLVILLDYPLVWIHLDQPDRLWRGRRHRYTSPARHVHFLHLRVAFHHERHFNRHLPPAEVAYGSSRPARAFRGRAALDLRDAAAW